MKPCARSPCTLALVLLVSLALIPACGRGSEGGRDHRAARIIKTRGFLPPASPLTRDGTPGSLGALGDINADGYTDIVVASATYPGSIEAHSGRDGEVLWQVKALVGKQAQRANEKGYTLNDIALLGDLNGDGFPEVYAQNAWTNKEFFIFSGKDGRRLARHDAFGATRPLRSEDVTGDGVADLIFSLGPGLGIRVVSGADLSPVSERTGLSPKEGVRYRWLMARYPDLD